MSLNLPKLIRRYRLRITGVIHIGAHHGEEYDAYRQCSIRRQVWIEPQPDAFRELRQALPNSPDIQLFNIACGATRGEATMYLMAGNEGASSSLLPPGEHLRLFPDIQPAGTMTVPVVRLDDLLAGARAARDHNVLALDVQGYELACLQGAAGALAAHIHYIMCEVSTIELYQGGTRLPELDSLLSSAGFVRVYTKWLHRGHGDALFIKRSILPWWRRAHLALAGGREKGPR